MKLRCLARRVSPAQKVTVQMDNNWDPLFEISVDHIYVTLGISFVLAPLYWVTPLYWIRDDAGRCMPIPSCLFDIVDARPSTHWKVFKFEEAGLNIFPDEFTLDYFHDRLSDGDAHYAAIFSELVTKLEHEYE